MRKNSHSSIIINSQNLDIVQVFISGRMDKLCTYNGNGVENSRAMKINEPQLYTKKLYIYDGFHNVE